MYAVKIRSKGSRLYNKGEGLRVPGFRRKGMFIGLGTMILGLGFIGLCFWIPGVVFRLQSYRVGRKQVTGSCCRV
jgi:hypothetical protein